jgi:tetratricopeptide (TPR) repeat protein
MDRVNMRAGAVPAIGLLISWLAPAAWAQTQVKAENCSSAVNGPIIGSSIEIHCLGEEDIARVLNELIRQGRVRLAEDVGIEPKFIVSLAARLKPTQKLDFAQAVVEVSHAVDIAINVAKEGSGGSSDQFADEVLKRVADKTRANDPTGATREAEDGFARWEKQEAERRAKATATGVALLEAALKTDLLRFDAAAATGRVGKIASLQHDGDPNAQFEAIHTWYEQFYVEGKDKGINFSLEVAIAIARQEVTLAQGPAQHSAALNDLGAAGGELGGRESGTVKLDEAVAACRAALNARPRDRDPLGWAATQNNLGKALMWLGERESGTARLVEAVDAYRAALDERAQDRAPLDWAMTQVFLGNTLETLGERESGTARLEEAVVAYRAALTEFTRERFPLQWARTQNGICYDLAKWGERDKDTTRLEEAVAACRAALEKRPGDLDPLGRAATQDSLGYSLRALGELQGGTARLVEAVKAYQAALETYTPERVPLKWAMTTGNQGVAMILIADRTNDSSVAERAVDQIKTASDAEQAGGQVVLAGYYRAQLVKAQAIRDRLKVK